MLRWILCGSFGSSTRMLLREDLDGEYTIPQPHLLLHLLQMPPRNQKLRSSCHQAHRPYRLLRYGNAPSPIPHRHLRMPGNVLRLPGRQLHHRLPMLHLFLLTIPRTYPPRKVKFVGQAMGSGKVERAMSASWLMVGMVRTATIVIVPIVVGWAS